MFASQEFVSGVGSMCEDCVQPQVVKDYLDLSHAKVSVLGPMVCLSGGLLPRIPSV